MPTIIDVATGISLAQSRSLRMLWGQPWLEMEGTGTGFRLTDRCAERQKVMIRASFEKARAEQIQFCIFPEYSLPKDMIVEVDRFVESANWPNGSVWIAGIAPLSIAEFNGLASSPGSVAAGVPLRAESAAFINCLCAWMKSSNGDVQRVFQAKLRPSRPEQSTQGMYEGDHVFLFHTDILSFCCLICFDCIGISVRELVSSFTKEVPSGNSKNVDLTVVLEHNENPENSDFLAFAEQLLLPENTKLRTGLGASVAFINTAHKYHGRAVNESFGRSNLCYLRRANWPPYEQGPLTVVPNTFAMENRRNSLLRVRFREDGAALHSFRYYIPSLLGASSGVTKYPVDQAHVHKLDAAGGCQDGQSTPPILKVFTDWLSSSVIDGDGRFTAATGTINEAVEAGLLNIVSSLQSCTAARIEELVTLLLGSYVGYSRPASFNPDMWQTRPSGWVTDPHGQAIVELVSVLTVLSLVSKPELAGCGPTHTCKLEQVLVTVLDGRGDTPGHKMLSAYHKWLTELAWVDTVGSKTLLVVTRAASMPGSDIATAVPRTYPTAGEDEMASLPPGVRPNRNSFLETASQLFWISGMRIREVLLSTSIDDARQELRRALEPATIS
ncbi:MAG: hypothetical protein WCF30_00055 [Terracidiphilus sp.]